MRPSPPIILLSGMGATGRLFDLIRPGMSDLKSPDWIAPKPGETLNQYAARFADLVNPGVPCIVGGLSFGGMVALEMAPHLSCRHCVLIGSIRSPAELPLWVRVGARIARRLPLWCFRFSIFAARCVPGPILWLVPMDRREFLRDYTKSDPVFLRWALDAMLNWKPSTPGPDLAIHQIHGDNDPILFHTLTKPDTLVPGAGHLIPLSHPQVCIEYLRRIPENP